MSGFKLDDYQKKFCEDPEKAIRLLAPAGSGKTQSLLFRCKHIANGDGGQNCRFLIFSFTRAASGELQERLKNEFQDLLPQVEIITLDAWAQRRLKNQEEIHSPTLIKDSRRKHYHIHNTLQPCWAKHEILKDILTSVKGRGNNTVNQLFDILDGFMICGFQHDMDKESYFRHCLLLEEYGLDKCFEATVVNKLKDIEIIENDINYDKKRLSKNEKLAHYVLAREELKTKGTNITKSNIEELIKEKFSSAKMATKISKQHEHRYNFDENEIEKIKKKNPQIYRIWERTKQNHSEKSDFEQATDEVYKHFFPFWKKAVTNLKEQSLFTFNSYKYWCHHHLVEKSHKYSIGKNRYTDVMVDEFQDIDFLDLSLLKAIAEHNKTELTIVGDDDQAIFGWRGAIPDFITKPDAYVSENQKTTHVFENNYRSPKNIVEISQKLIKNNKNRVSKNVKSTSNELAEVKVEPVTNVEKAIDFVLNEVETKKGSIALIGRKRSQIIPYQIVFASKGIKFYAAEDLQIFFSKAFEGLREFLQLKDNPNQDPYKYLISLCDKIKNYKIKTQEREDLQSYFRKNPPGSIKDAIELLKDYKGKIKGRDMSAEFAEIIEGFHNSKTVEETINNISEKFEGFRKDYGKSLDDVFYSEPPFYHLAEYASRYGKDYKGFVEDLQKTEDTLLTEYSESELEENGDWKNRVHLMTALRAKGKEFDNVIVLDANKEIWPNKLVTDEAGLEQERRLFYVVTTRAKKKLIYLVNEKIRKDTALPSPYLSEMGLL